MAEESFEPLLFSLSRDNCYDALSLCHKSWDTNNVHMSKETTKCIFKTLFYFEGCEEAVDEYVAKCEHCKHVVHDCLQDATDLTWTLTPFNLSDVGVTKDMAKTIARNTKVRYIELQALDYIRHGKTTPAHEEELEAFRHPKEYSDIEARGGQFRTYVMLAYEVMHNVEEEDQVINVGMDLYNEYRNMFLLVMAQHLLEILKQAKLACSDLSNNVLLKYIETEKSNMQVRAEEPNGDITEAGAVGSNLDGGKGGADDGSQTPGVLASSQNGTNTVVIGDDDREVNSVKSPRENESKLHDEDPQSPSHKPPSKCRDAEAKPNTELVPSEDSNETPREESNIEVGQPVSKVDDTLPAKQPSINGEHGVFSKPALATLAAAESGMDLAPVDDILKDIDGIKKCVNMMQEFARHTEERLDTLKTNVIKFYNPPRSIGVQTDNSPSKGEPGVATQTTPVLSSPQKKKKRKKQKRKSAQNAEDTTELNVAKDCPTSVLSAIEEQFWQTTAPIKSAFLTKHHAKTAVLTMLFSLQIQPRNESITERLLPEPEGVTCIDNFIAVLSFPLEKGTSFYDVVLAVETPFWMTYCLYEGFSTALWSYEKQSQVLLNMQDFVEQSSKRKIKSQTPTHTRFILPATNFGLCCDSENIFENLDLEVVPDCFVDYFLGHVLYIIKYITETVHPEFRVDQVLDKCATVVAEVFNLSWRNPANGRTPEQMVMASNRGEQ